MGGASQQVKQVARQYGLATVLWCGILSTPMGVLYAMVMGHMDFHSIAVEGVLAMMGGAFVGLLAAILNIKRFFRPIGIMIQFVNGITNGDVSRSLKEYSFGPMEVMKKAFDHMGRAINALMISMTKKIEEIGRASAALSKEAEGSSRRAHEVAAAVAQVARGSHEQALAVQEIASEINSVKDLVSRMASKVQGVASHIDVVESMVQQGSVSMSEQKSKMEANRTVIDQMAAAIDELADNSRKIGAIMEVIGDIAGQTNLLALNASIEAARTGDRGRGFQVVAQEVRKLAEESSSAAREIGALITDIQTSIDLVVSETQVARKTLADQESAIDDNQRVIDRVAENFGVIVREMGEVAAACDTIVVTTEQISSVMEEISVVTQENSAGAQEISTTAELQASHMQKLYEVSGRFLNLVSRFRELAARFKLDQEDRG